MDPSEVEFLAEKQTVTIIPNFSLDKIYLITGDLGPFNPGLPVDVPVWLAINLKQRQKCRIVVPDWMDVDKLEQIKEQERKEETFTPMPNPHYIELTKLLLKHASDNIPKADEIRTLVKDTWDTRIAKLRLSADNFVSQQEVHAKLQHCILEQLSDHLKAPGGRWVTCQAMLDNLTLMEINTIGTFLTESLNQMHSLRANLQPGEKAQSQDY